MKKIYKGQEIQIEENNEFPRIWIEGWVDGQFISGAFDVETVLEECKDYIDTKQFLFA
ncbi:MAG: hypothetical protein ACOC3Z_03190 [Nanoarchaeota archaeon]